MTSFITIFFFYSRCGIQFFVPVHCASSSHLKGTIYLRIVTNNLYSVAVVGNISKDIQSDYKELNSIVWVRERIIPTERPPLVGEVIANFFLIEVATW
jgi:hypothetical protein